MAQVGSYESLESCFSPLVEAFEQRDGKGVLQAIVRRLVVDGIARQCANGVEGVGIEVGRRLIGLVYAAVVVKLQRVYETCHGHVFRFHPHSVLRGLSLYLF